MADKRAFAKFDVGYLDNPKMLPVLDASPNAVLMHFASVLYCAQHLTDGFVTPRAMQRRTGATSDDAQILLDAGLWHAPGHDCGSCPDVPEGKAYVHDFLEHNRSSEGVKRASEAGRKGAESRWNKSAEPNANRNANGNAENPESQCLEREKEREINTPSSPATPSTEFAAFWAAYPKKVAKQAAIKAWDKAMKIADPQQVIEGAKRYALFIEREKTDKKFIKSPDGWLNAGRWEDDITVTTTPKQVSPWDMKGVHA